MFNNNYLGERRNEIIQQKPNQVANQVMMIIKFSLDVFLNNLKESFPTIGWLYGNFAWMMIKEKKKKKKKKNNNVCLNLIIIINDVMWCNVFIAFLLMFFFLRINSVWWNMNRTDEPNENHKSNDDEEFWMKNFLSFFFVKFLIEIFFSNFYNYNYNK